MKDDDAFFLHIGIFLALVFLDQASKLLIQQSIVAGHSVPVLFFHFTHVANTGASFGILASYPLLLLIVALVALVLCFSFYAKFSDYRLLLILIAGGIVGNVIDRFLYGHVVDFIDLPLFPAVFNMADMMIFFGIILLIIMLWKEDMKKKHGTRA